MLLGVTLLIGCNPREAAVDLAQSTAGLFELNTKVNQFVEMESGDPLEATVGGYEIDLVMQAVRPGDLNGIDSFRITIDTRYGEKVSSEAEALAVPALRIDSLTIRVLFNDSTFRPYVFADNYVERKDKPEIRNKRLYGPSYRYSLFKMSFSKIELWFDAVLVDRKSGALVSRERVTRTLEMVSQLKYYKLPSS